LKKKKVVKRTSKKKGLQFIGGTPYNCAGSKGKKMSKSDPFSFGKGDGDKAGNEWLKKAAKKAKW
jgi:hypothetical protein